MNHTFGGKYKLEVQLANGGCGTVFTGVHTIAGKEVAIKLEHTADAPHPSMSPLKQESKIYKTLMGGPGIPWIMWSGTKDDYNVMVIDLLGPSLEDLFRMCNKSWSLKTVLLLADQLISRIQYIHSRDLVHRDVKPANFVMGTGRNASSVNVIDFGLAKKYRDPRNSLHIPYKQDDCHGVGTSLFAAINTHIGVESSRRDDLESLAYMLIYFLRGSLPWRKLRGSSIAETWSLILEKKLETAELLTVGLPKEFDDFYTYIRGLDFYDEPDYDGLRDMLRGLAKKHGIEYDGQFDWMVSKPKKSSVYGGVGVGNGAGNGAAAALAKRKRFCRTCDACAAAAAAAAEAAKTSPKVPKVIVGGGGRRTVSGGSGSTGRRRT
ncbi:kinase-like domain-containing protein [Abortiporus biennis]|nr:kinase-like domain-containing protein [Abortiporus biennis]